ncbi:hypothetical protein AOLI_G00012100 [Acnodon oligacanthus]
MLVSHRYRVEETTVFKQSARKPTSRPRRDTESPAPAEETTEEQALCKPLGTEKHRYCRFEDAIGKVFSKFERQEEYRGL